MRMREQKKVKFDISNGRWSGASGAVAYLLDGPVASGPLRSSIFKTMALLLHPIPPAVQDCSDTAFPR